MFDMRSFLKGLALGLAGKPLEFAPKSEPVAYLYNGFNHPALPDVDRSKYPYVCLADLVTIGYLFFSTSPLIRKEAMSVGAMKNYCYICEQAGSVLAYVDHDIDDNELEYWITGEGTGVESMTKDFEAGKTVIGTVFSSSIEWTNHDILNEDGTVYLAASEPVPVYE